VCQHPDVFRGEVHCRQALPPPRAGWQQPDHLGLSQCQPDQRHA
jgi:hypothetical protein